MGKKRPGELPKDKCSGHGQGRAGRRDELLCRVGRGQVEDRAEGAWIQSWKVWNGRFELNHIQKTIGNYS